MKNSTHSAIQEHLEAKRPAFATVMGTVIGMAALFLLSIQTTGGIAPFEGTDGVRNAALFFALIAILSLIAEYIFPSARNYVFAFTIGTVATFILIGFYEMLFHAGEKQDPFFMGLGVLCVIMAWRFLFGQWRPSVKTAVLGTFIFWVAVHIFWNETPDERSARALAAIVAIVPAVIWCVLFLKEHTQRIGLVFLMFLAGMLSTAPILFYDAMVRHQIELQFFVFRIVPENFNATSSAFVSGNLVGIVGMPSTMIATLVAFLIVGIIEETSKFWVLKKSGEQFFSSIDDVLQLGIIAAIGFAFAENVMNPTYFVSFIEEHLIQPVTPQWGAFLGNVLGRAILTTMVHVVSTGVLGYFYGLTLFAGPVLLDERKAGKVHPIPLLLHALTRFPEKGFFRRQMMIMGFISAVTLHGLFNFIVTLPDLLPGNPHTLGDILGSPEGSPFHLVALLIVPSLFYVVGGFWLLSLLFERKESQKERGILIHTDTFVDPKTFYSGLSST